VGSVCTLVVWSRTERSAPMSGAGRACPEVPSPCLELREKIISHLLALGVDRLKARTPVVTRLAGQCASRTGVLLGIHPGPTMNAVWSRAVAARVRAWQGSERGRSWR
jgi:hypothetical protein